MAKGWQLGVVASDHQVVQRVPLCIDLQLDFVEVLDRFRGEAVGLLLEVVVVVLCVVASVLLAIVGSNIVFNCCRCVPLNSLIPVVAALFQFRFAMCV